jgi:hypothetical protein
MFLEIVVGLEDLSAECHSSLAFSVDIKSITYVVVAGAR